MALADCQRDSYLKSLPATVLACTQVPGIGPFDEKKAVAEAKDKKKPAKGNDKKDEKKEEKKEDPYYEVQLSNTCAFPTGGGQPHDLGQIDAIPFLSVYRTGAQQNVVHVTRSPLQVGQQVTVQIDWQRRFDHMQQHTGQHLISAVAMNKFNWKTLSWCLTEYPRECYIELDAADMKDDQMAALEAEINAHIRRSLPTKVHVFNSLEEAKSSELAIRSKGIPEGIAGPIRIIEIKDTDFNTCCGTHLQNVNEIQMVCITKKEKNKKNTIIYFLAGGRALDSLTKMSAAQRKFSTMLGGGPDKHIDAITRIQTENRAQAKKLDKILKELAVLQAEHIVATAIKSNNPIAAIHREEGGLAYMSALAEAVANCPEGKTSPVAQNILLFVTDEESGQFLLSGPEVAVTKYGQVVAKALDARGGGKKGKFQGKTNSGSLSAEQHKTAAALIKADW